MYDMSPNLKILMYNIMLSGSRKERLESIVCNWMSVGRKKSIKSIEWKEHIVHNSSQLHGRGVLKYLMPTHFFAGHCTVYEQNK